VIALLTICLVWCGVEIVRELVGEADGNGFKPERCVGPADRRAHLPIHWIRRAG
jgi:hypothetical protein